jgi:hypothetical protein
MKKKKNQFFIKTLFVTKLSKNSQNFHSGCFFGDLLVNGNVGGFIFIMTLSGPPIGGR